ncbi:MAG: SH3 domain-containing protein, partial [Pseudomonadota bacterium]
LGWVHSAYMELEDPPAANRTSGEVNGFRVVGVRADDRLNIRIAPSSEARIVATIPPFGRGIRIIGACADVWCPIAYRQANGWVNSLFIEREDGQSTTRVR